MSDVIQLNESEDIIPAEASALIENSAELLNETREELMNHVSCELPIAEISTLGAGVSSLIPAFRTVQHTCTLNSSEKLYRVINMEAGDALKTAKAGFNWGAIETTDGASKMAKLQAVGDLKQTETTVMAVNPATIMIAVALFSIEQQLGKIEETTKQIQRYLEIEKQAKVESDIETLLASIQSYKHNWDNMH